MFKLEFLVLIYCATVCYGIEPQLIVYTGHGCTGEGFIVQTKHPDLLAEAPRIIPSFTTFLGVGFWRISGGVNFTNGGYTISWEESPRCNVWSSPALKSARYLGPPDTQTKSLSLYENIGWGGSELTITGPAFGHLPFSPQSIFTTGATSWTFYSGNNFDGNATCFIPRSDSDRWHDYIQVKSSIAGSILRGCEGHIDQFIYGDDNNDEFALQL